MGASVGEASPASDGDGASGRRMSVREKRMHLMQNARRSGSLPNSPVVNSTYPPIFSLLFFAFFLANYFHVKNAL